MAANLGTAVLTIETDASGLKKGLAKAESAAKQTEGTMGRVAKSVPLPMMAAAAAAGAAALAIGAGLAKIGRDSILAAADVEEATSLFHTIFEGEAANVAAWADTNAEAMNRSSFELQNYAANLGAIIAPMGFAADETANLSQNMTGLIVDLASLRNFTEEQVMLDFQSMLAGSAETMTKYGVEVKEGAVNTELLAMGLVKGSKGATQQQKTIARMNIIVRETAKAQGDAIKTSKSFTNEMKGLGGKVRDASRELGASLLPAATKFVKLLANPGIPMLLKAVGVFKQIWSWLGKVTKTFKAVWISIKPVVTVLNQVMIAGLKLTPAFAAMTSALSAFRSVTESIFGWSNKVVDAQTAQTASTEELATATEDTVYDFSQFQAMLDSTKGSMEGVTTAADDQALSWDEISNKAMKVADSIGKGEEPKAGTPLRGMRDLVGALKTVDTTFSEVTEAAVGPEGYIESMKSKIDEETAAFDKMEASLAALRQTEKDIAAEQDAAIKAAQEQAKQLKAEYDTTFNDIKKRAGDVFLALFTDTENAASVFTKLKDSFITFFTTTIFEEILGTAMATFLTSFVNKIKKKITDLVTDITAKIAGSALGGLLGIGAQAAGSGAIELVKGLPKHLQTGTQIAGSVAGGAASVASGVANTVMGGLGGGLFQMAGGALGGVLGALISGPTKGKEIEQNTRFTHILLKDMHIDKLQPIKEKLQWARENLTDILGRFDDFRGADIPKILKNQRDMVEAMGQVLKEERRSQEIQERVMIRVEAAVDPEGMERTLRNTIVPALNRMMESNVRGLESLEKANARRFENMTQPSQVTA